MFHSFSTPLLLLFFATALSAQEIIVSLTCTIVSDSLQPERETRRTKRLLDVAGKLITLREGQPVDTAELQASIDALQVCGMFERVDLRRSPGTIAFRLTPAQYIRDIRFTGEYPLFEEDVEKALSIFPGAIFRREEIDRQDSMVTGFYQQEGFIAPHAIVKTKGHRAGRRNRVVEVRITPGDYYRLQTVTVTGNRVISDFEIKLRMKSYLVSRFPGSAGRFVETVYRKDLKTLTEFYRSQRFADVAIRDTIIADPATRTARVALFIDEGDRYTVRLPEKPCRCGVGAGVLQKSIVLYKYGNRNNLGVRRSVQAITRKIKEAGCVDAKVTASDTSVKRRRYNERIIGIAVDPGRRTAVSSIKFHGARSLDEKMLRDQMLHTDRGNAKKRAYIADKLQGDVFAITSLYRSYGFLKAHAGSSVRLHRQNADITIDIQEGTRTLIGNVSIDTAGFSGKALTKAITVEKGASYRPDQLKRDAYALQAIVSEQGYPHATVTPAVTMNGDSSNADVFFAIDEDQPVVLGSIHYVGAFRTRRRIFNRELKAKEGSPFSLREIINSQKEFRDIGLFNSIRYRTIGLAEKRDTVHLFVEVAERKSYYGAFGAGFRSDKDWYLNAKVGDRNIRGWNQDAWVKGEKSGTGFRVETGLLDPRLLGSRLSALVNLYQEQSSEQHQDWISKAYGISSGLTVKIGKRMTAGLGTRYERRRLSYKVDAKDTLALDIADDRRPRDVLTATPSFTFDNRDSFTRPRKGLFLSTSIDLSKSFRNSLDNFIKVQFEARQFVTPLPRLTVAGVLRGGYVRPYGGATVIPKDRRFYLGGTGDVRGFAENQLHPADTGNTVSLSAAIEARMEIGWNFELTAFTDIGRLENNSVGFTRDQFRQSVGMGIRYITLIGPIGVLYGRKVTRPEGQGEARGVWHFSLGYTF